VLPVASYVQCELIRAVAAERLMRRVGAVDTAYLTKIDIILRRILQL
jgi:mRNA-degrading endonuclease toxin of MazEF toxin-antitoxin module